jgi:hypothetical protein
MLTTRVRILSVCTPLAVLSACSASPTTPARAPGAQPVTVTLPQSSRPWTQFRVQVGGGAFAPLPLERLGTEFRFQGSAGGYLLLLGAARPAATNVRTM